MEITFSPIPDLNNGSAPPNLTLEIADDAITPTFARIRLVFKTDIPIGTTLELLGTTFTASTETALPYGFEASSPALSMQVLLGYYPVFNEYEAIPESTHTLIIAAKNYGSAYLPNATLLVQSNAIDQIEILEEGASLNPYFNLINKLHIHYTTGLAYSANSTWVSSQQSAYRKLLPFTAKGIHQIPNLPPSETIPFSKLPQEGLVRYPLSAIQIKAYLQQAGGELTKIATSEVLLLIPNAPQSLSVDHLLPTADRFGSPLNDVESPVLVQGALATPLYFIVPSEAFRYQDPNSSIQLLIETIEGTAIVSSTTVTIGTISTPGLYCYWLSATTFLYQNAMVTVKVKTNTQTLYQGKAWEFSLLQNTNPILCLGYLNAFGLPTILSIPIVNSYFKDGKKFTISTPLPLQKSTIDQWKKSSEKWMVENEELIPNTVTSISYQESTDNLLTLIIENDEQ